MAENKPNSSIKMSLLKNGLHCKTRAFKSLFQRHCENHREYKMLKDQTLKLGDARLWACRGSKMGVLVGNFDKRPWLENLFTPGSKLNIGWFSTTSCHIFFEKGSSKTPAVELLKRNALEVQKEKMHGNIVRLCLPPESDHSKCQV